MAFVNLVQYRSQFDHEVAEKSAELLQGQKLEVAVFLINELLSRTPVDTGELRGGWHVTVGTPSGFDIDSPDVLGALAAHLSDPDNYAEPLFIQNNKPHAPVVEFGQFDPPNPGPSKDPRPGRHGAILVRNGFSTQAPNGIMGDSVAATAERFNLGRTAD